MAAVKIGLSALVLAAGSPALAQTAAPVAAPVQPIRASKIILVGDSTTQVLSGWGGSFCAYHVTSFAACVNLGRGGRSTLSYRAEGSWDLALAEMRTPGFVATYVLIQFGHNDQPGKPGRSTDLATEFPANLCRYVAETRAAGAVPVLLTPLTRRQFRDGRLNRDLDAWADSIRAVAAETHTPLVDLNRISADAVQAMGPVASLRLAQVAPPADVAAAAERGTSIAAPKTEVVVQPTSPSVLSPATLAFDYTHVGRDGADVVSKMVVDGLAGAVPAMRPLLVP